ncbi:hypothetical protein K7G98_23755 [Saccharothrix sp. MB29]|nr:hypothetical protein [Saccharothrix sp. MB29]
MQDLSGARPLDLGDELTALVAERARELGITPFAFLLGRTAWRCTAGPASTASWSVALRPDTWSWRAGRVAGNLVPVLLDVDDDLPTGPTCARSRVAGAQHRGGLAAVRSS